MAHFGRAHQPSSSPTLAHHRHSRLHGTRGDDGRRLGTGLHCQHLRRLSAEPGSQLPHRSPPAVGVADPLGINDRGQIVGFYENPAATPDGQRSPMPMTMLMSASLTADERVLRRPPSHQWRSGWHCRTAEIPTAPALGHRRRLRTRRPSCDHDRRIGADPPARGGGRLPAGAEPLHHGHGTPDARAELIPYDINDRGQIVGQLTIDASRNIGFVRDRRSRINTFRPSGRCRHQAARDEQSAARSSAATATSRRSRPTTPMCALSCWTGAG